MKLKSPHFAALLSVFLLASPGFGQNGAQNGPRGQRIRGTVDSYQAPTLTVKTADGQTVVVVVPADLRIMANAKTSLADIKPGDFVGSAADKGPDGKLHAEEVHVFPESMRGAGEGHRPMGPDPSRTATTGTVAPDTVANDPEARTMTNGTVSAAQGNGTRTRTRTRTLKIAYKDGVQDIEVSPDTPIITIVVGDSSLLKPGATVALVAMQKDGVLTATNLNAEKDGVKPR